ncbi:Hypothetical protein, putative [Bodo saltans]|uniref:Uncharacterized protein n=1 Tax=Bodo saltans TaxID=75058 RepID=A0A0S4IKR8_BODSA|nr:Hypothetical protein, putative [Bodo saltans]|eukprot:CUE68560.1 Hypothetical protein, putative [Bodo saltans]
MYSRAWGGSGSKLMAPDDAHDQHQHRHLMDELRLKEVELERCYAELDRLVATTHLTSSATALRGESAQLHELQRDVAMFTSSLRSVESQRDRLAAELRLSAACIENLDQRLLLSERELLQARLALAAKQTLHDGEPTPSKTENGGPLDIVALPLAARMHLARLSAEISALQSQLAQMQQDEQRRAAFDRDVQEELKHHNASLEDQLTDLMSKLAGEMERHEGTRQSYEALEATLAELHHSSIVVARLIKTSKTDVDGVVEVAAGRCDSAAGHPTTSVTVLDVLRPFALQVGRDLSAVSQLLVLVRESAAKHGVKTEIVDDDIVVRQVDPTVAAPRSIKPPQHSKQTSAAPAAGAPPAKRRILIAPSVSSRQSSQDSAVSGLRSTGLGWQRAGAPTALAARSLERSPSPAYPTH